MQNIQNRITNQKEKDNRINMAYENFGGHSIEVKSNKQDTNKHGINTQVHSSIAKTFDYGKNTQVHTMLVIYLKFKSVNDLK